MAHRKLIGDFATTDQQVEEQNDIADYIFGRVARRDGMAADNTKSAAWQRDWFEAQE